MGSLVYSLSIARDGCGAMFRSFIPWLSWLQLMAYSEAASFANVVCTDAFWIGILALMTVVPVSISTVRPFLLCFRRHPFADLAALSAAPFPFMYLSSGAQPEFFHATSGLSG